MAGAIAAQTAGVARVENRVELSTKLSDRFEVAMQAVTEKLVRLVAATPLLIIALAHRAAGRVDRPRPLAPHALDGARAQQQPVHGSPAPPHRAAA